MAEPEPEAGSYFVSAYPPFSTWSPAARADYRAALDAPADGAVPCGLYVHVPFCVERCVYCYYLSHADRAGEIDRYIDALVREAELYAACPALAGRRLDFVYFGGGTPSLLSTRRVRRLADGLRSALSWAAAREVTFECAPRSVTAPKLAALREAGVTRLSLGVQHLDDRVLRLSGRVHLVADVGRAWAAIREVGFPQVNIDLIVGLPGETDDSFRESLERVLALGPESITIYQLELPPNTPLYAALRDGTLPAPLAGWEIKRARLAAGFARLESAGYTVRSAYAAVRDPGRHPFVYQDEQYRGADLVGIGASAFSYLAGVHQQNEVRLDRYLEAVAAGRLPLGRAKALGAEERLVREFVLQLKLGFVAAEPFRRKFGVAPAERFAEPLARHAARGWLTVEPAGVRLTRAGLLRADRLLPDYYLSEHRGLRYS